MIGLRRCLKPGVRGLYVRSSKPPAFLDVGGGAVANASFVVTAAGMVA